jgi:hypothetical protein
MWPADRRREEHPTRHRDHAASKITLSNEAWTAFTSPHRED